MKAFVNPGQFGMSEEYGMYATIVFINPGYVSQDVPLYLEYGTDLTSYTWEEICDAIESKIGDWITNHSLPMTTSDIIWMCPRT